MHLQEGAWGYGLDYSGSAQENVADFCKHGNEPSGSKKCGGFLDQLKTGWLLTKDSASWNMGNRVKRANVVS